jgi:8-oxo-dGTP diphosphatase
MKQYVAGFMKDSQGQIALVRKNKPKWQAGRLNGIGGGVEEGELPLKAMYREWHEETGTGYFFWNFFAELRFDDCAVHFFKANVAALPALPSHNDIGEAIEIHNYDTAVRFTDMIPNLKWLLPLAFEDPQAGWVRSTPWPHLRAANDNAAPATQVAA